MQKNMKKLKNFHKKKGNREVLLNISYEGRKKDIYIPPGGSGRSRCGGYDSVCFPGLDK